ncbi:HAMP domain-containing histidine kinase [Solirubrobacter ginsenosidimutans]|uniref:histidine kinase n=1 Tax=Solirubrobacter ginsenosidimutans TaxID=490573 RepID=A0A9X3S4B8_9ACTN|nr:HAMP domain-containing sensor histidine kinase [Solirubrobacter ginsenosidimutans]MDA0160438.1 HAMP domain-containing histidine kinase [Solirubrobacter ginsenosidimutans]
MKVTLAFSGVMAVVLAFVGIVLYLRFESELDETLNQGLRSRAGDVSALIQRSGSALDAPGGSVLVERGESFAQILLASDGAVVDGSPKLKAESLLTPALLARGARETFIFTRPNPFELGEPARLLVTPVTARGRELVVVVGAGADDRNSQLHSLGLLLAVSWPVALLLASLAGYGVASAALRPVEAMRRKADEITEDHPGDRLPVGDADDEIARLGRTLNGMLARLEHAVERERAFVSDASHEFRMPLAVLKTELELALKGDRPREMLRDALQSASDETDRLAELADALLVIARADGGRLHLATAELDTADLLDGVSVRFGARVRASGRSLVVDQGQSAQIIADPHRLEQALGNLVENALRYGDGDIHLGATAAGDTIALFVRDEGPGFPPEFVAQAFERFTRADHARSRGGAGLGLSIVQAIAHAHGGEARATNDPDGGARVSIVLPVDDTDEARLQDDVETARESVHERPRA